MGRVDGSVVQARDYTHRQNGGIGNVGGDVGTFINTANGPLHTGSGEQHNEIRNGGVQFTGEGANYLERGTVNQKFGDRREREERDEREERRRREGRQR